MTATGSSDGGSNRLAVLVVEDEPFLREEIVDCIAAEGYPVLAAEGVVAARAWLDSRTDIGVMISDIRMPDGDGIELTETVLRDRSDQFALEVILITGHATLDMALSAIGTGAREMLRKPVGQAALLGALSPAMARAIGRRAIADRTAERDAGSAGPPSGAAALATMAARVDGLLAQSGVTAFGALSHELRTPLVPIIGYAELLAETAETAQSREIANEIAVAGHGLVGIVNAMLQLVDLQSGRVSLQVLPCDLGKLLKSVVHSETKSLLGRGDSVDNAVAAGLSVRADPAVLAEALRALLRMVQQCMPRGTCLRLTAAGDAGMIELQIAVYDAHMAAALPSLPGTMQDATARLAAVSPISLRLCAHVIELHRGSLSLLHGARPLLAAIVRLPAAD